MIKRVYSESYEWFRKYKRGNVLIVFAYVLSVIVFWLGEKAGWTDIRRIVVNKSINFPALLVYALIWPVHTWTQLVYARDIYAGEKGAPKGGIFGRDIVSLIVPALVCSVFVSAVFSGSLMGFVSLAAIGTGMKEPGFGIYLALMVLIASALVPFIVWFSLRIGFYLQVMVAENISGPVEALKRSFSITRGGVMRIIRTILIPMVVASIVFSFASKPERGILLNIAGALGNGLFYAFMYAVYMRLYFDFSGKPADTPRDSR